MKPNDCFKFVNEKKECRPYTEDGVKDGNWDYIHRTFVWDLIDNIFNSKEEYPEIL